MKIYPAESMQNHEVVRFFLQDSAIRGKSIPDQDLLTSTHFDCRPVLEKELLTEPNTPDFN